MVIPVPWDRLQASDRLVTTQCLLSLRGHAGARVPLGPLTWERYLLAYLYISAMATLVLNSLRYFFIKTEQRGEEY